jgi:hypothetical protein
MTSHKNKLEELYSFIEDIPSSRINVMKDFMEQFIENPEHETASGYLDSVITFVNAQEYESILQEIREKNGIDSLGSIDSIESEDKGKLNMKDQDYIGNDIVYSVTSPF